MLINIVRVDFIFGSLVDMYWAVFTHSYLSHYLTIRSVYKALCVRSERYIIDVFGMDWFSAIVFAA